MITAVGVMLASALIVLQQNFSRTQSHSVTKIAQLEMAYLTLGWNYGFWDAFFRHSREQNADLSSQDVERAVGSLTRSGEKFSSIISSEATTPPPKPSKGGSDAFDTTDAEEQSGSDNSSIASKY